MADLPAPTTLTYSDCYGFGGIAPGRLIALEEFCSDRLYGDATLLYREQYQQWEEDRADNDPQDGDERYYIAAIPTSPDGIGPIEPDDRPVYTLGVLPGWWWAS